MPLETSSLSQQLPVTWAQSQAHGTHIRFIGLLEIHAHSRAYSEHSCIISGFTICRLWFWIPLTGTAWAVWMTSHIQSRAGQVWLYDLQTPQQSFICSALYLVGIAPETSGQVIVQSFAKCCTLRWFKWTRECCSMRRRRALARKVWINSAIGTHRNVSEINESEKSNLTCRRVFSGDDVQHVFGSLWRRRSTVLETELLWTKATARNDANL